MFLQFFFRELRTALKRPMVYFFTFIFALLVFGAVASDHVRIGGAIGLIHKNSPHVITVFVTVLSVFGLLFATAFCNNAALRDYQYQFDEILFTTPVKKISYFLGRFFGAFILSCIPFLGIFIGAYLASVIAPAAGWIEPDRIGAMHFQLLINEFLIFVLPNMFIGCAIIFWLAHRFKNTIVSFVGAFAVIVLYIISGTLLSDMSNRTLAALFDSFGARAYHVVAEYYSTADKNTIIPQFTGLLMENRLIWIAVAAVITILSYFNFKMKIRDVRLVRKNKKKEAEKAIHFSLPENIMQRFDFKAHWQQFKSIFSIDFKSIIKSPVFIILLIFCAIIIIVNITEGFAFFGLKTYPLTYEMVSIVSGNITLFTMIILIFFSGELIWRNRMHHFDEVINATPHPSIGSLLAHAASLFSVAVVFHFIFIVFAIIGQLVQGYFKIQLGIYLGSFALYSLLYYASFCCLFIFIQALFNNRYIGYLISVLFLFVSGIILSVFDIESHLADFASSPKMAYSDMNGFGPAVKSTIWFNIYWFLFGLFLLFIAGLFINRQKAGNFRERWQQAKGNLNRKYLSFGIIVFCLWLICGGWIYYNTQILNHYKTSDQTELLQARYEKKYKKYEHFPHPKIVSVNYHIKIYPHRRAFYAVSDLKLKNETTQPIDSLIYTLQDGWNMKLIIPNSKLILNDDSFLVQIFKLKQPLMPGMILPIKVEAHYAAKGFENSISNNSVVGNGTFVNNMAILPSFGYDRGYEISDINKRKKYHLLPRKRMPDLEKNCTTDCMRNYLSMGASDWIPATTTISTSADQTAIAPGSLIKHWTKDGRNYYVYRVDHPSQDFYSFQSARYKLAQREWNGIKLEVFYCPKHPYNVSIMLNSLQAALGYYIKNYGPYYHKEARIIEFPRYASFAQSYPGTMPYSEAIGFILDMRDTTQNNVIEAVVAHEMAHQYWAHQEIPAFMQGATMLTESFAEYSSLMVLKQTHTDLEMKKYLKYDYDRYLRGRGGEKQKEVPLYKVENQEYIHYGKGSVILYSLGQMIGTDSLNGALREFLDDYKYKNPPYPNTYDFLAILRKHTPDSLQYLIRDWIKKITFYDLRMKKATAQKLANGKYKVSMTITAQKYYSDSIGNEKVAPMNTMIELGLFADKDEKDLFFNKKVRVNKPKMTFTFTVDSLPQKAMIDPLRLYMEKIVKDNDADVQVVK